MPALIDSETELFSLGERRCEKQTTLYFNQVALGFKKNGN